MRPASGRTCYRAVSISAHMIWCFVSLTCRSSGAKGIGVTGRVFLLFNSNVVARGRDFPDVERAAASERAGGGLP